uniref:Uncharacterized protein n=1 Tax=Coturnix japonica TaxID=93934 RepID=A0A8C2T4K4_COTJA
MLPGLCVPRSRCPAVHCQPGSAPIRAAARSRFTAPRPDSAPAGLTTLRGCRGWGSRPWTQRGSVCRAFPAPCPRCSPRSAGAQGGCACPGLHPTPVGSCPLSAPTHGRTGPVLPCGLLCCAVPTSCQRCPFRRPTAAPSRPLCAPFLPGADAPLPRSAVLFGAELPAVPVCGSRSHLPRPGAAPPGGRGPHGSHGLRAASRCVTGIGKCVAMELARRNARTILACRSRERGQAALEEIRAATGNPNVVLRLLDSSSMASVRAFAGQVLREEKRLDVLVNNAAVTGTTPAHRDPAATPPRPHRPRASCRAALRNHGRGAGTDLRHQLPGPVPAHQPAAGPDEGVGARPHRHRVVVPAQRGQRGRPVPHRAGATRGLRPHLQQHQAHERPLQRGAGAAPAGHGWVLGRDGSCWATLCCAMLCRAILCHAVPYCAVPCCAMLCHIVPCHIVPCCAVLCRAMLCHAVPYCAVPYCAMLCCAVLCCAELCRVVPYCAARCCAVPCHVVPCSAEQYCAMPCHAMLCHAMLCHAMLCHAMLCCAILCCAPIAFGCRLPGTEAPQGCPPIPTAQQCRGSGPTGGLQGLSPLGTPRDPHGHGLGGGCIPVGSGPFLLPWLGADPQPYFFGAVPLWGALPAVGQMLTVPPRRGDRQQPEPRRGEHRHHAQLQLGAARPLLPHQPLPQVGAAGRRQHHLLRRLGGGLGHLGEILRQRLQPHAALRSRPGRGAGPQTLGGVGAADGAEPVGAAAPGPPFPVGAATGR